MDWKPVGRSGFGVMGLIYPMVSGMLWTCLFKEPLWLQSRYEVKDNDNGFHIEHSTSYLHTSICQ